MVPFLDCTQVSTQPSETPLIKLMGSSHCLSAALFFVLCYSIWNEQMFFISAGKSITLWDLDIPGEYRRKTEACVSTCSLQGSVRHFYQSHNLAIMAWRQTLDSLSFKFIEVHVFQSLTVLCAPHPVSLSDFLMSLNIDYSPKPNRESCPLQWTLDFLMLPLYHHPAISPTKAIVTVQK